MVGMKNQMTSHWWWLDSHNNPKRSPWLQSAIAELDEKTRDMLKLIEEDADSFARRAEMYYKKRPELISMVEDFYRAHRSLAERFDLLKSESGTGTLRLSALGSPLSSPRYRLEKPMTKLDRCNSYFETFDTEDSAESEVEDPEQEDETQIEEENTLRKIQLFQKDDYGIDDNEVRNLKKELEKLKEQNMLQTEQLLQKDEEKREVIRQLSMAMEILKEENLQLRKYIMKESPKKSNHFDFNKLKGIFLGKFYGSPKFEGSIVAL